MLVREDLILLGADSEDGALGDLDVALDVALPVKDHSHGADYLLAHFEAMMCSHI